MTLLIQPLNQHFHTDHYISSIHNAPRREGEPRKIHTHTHTLSCTYVHTQYSCVHTHTDYYEHSHIHTFTFMHTHTLLHTCIHTYILACAHTHTHTLAHLKRKSLDTCKSALEKYETKGGLCLVCFCLSSVLLLVVVSSLVFNSTPLTKLRFCKPSEGTRLRTYARRQRERKREQERDRELAENGGCGLPSCESAFFPTPTSS